MDDLNQLFLIVFIIGLVYILILNIIILSLVAVCAKLFYDLWLKTGKVKLTPQSDVDLHKKIAVAAAITAMNIEDGRGQDNYRLPATALVSAWQAVMRSDILRRHRTVR